MMKRKRIELLVWGGLLLTSGIAMPILFYKFDYVGTVVVCFEVIGLILSIMGISFLVMGILNAIDVTKYNKRLVAEKAKVYYSTNCVSCGRRVDFGYFDFKRRKGYKEGAAECPYCNKMLSFHFFKELKRPEEFI